MLKTVSLGAPNWKMLPKNNKENHQKYKSKLFISLGIEYLAALKMVSTFGNNVKFVGSFGFLEVTNSLNKPVAHNSDYSIKNDHWGSPKILGSRDSNFCSKQKLAQNG